MLGRSVGWFLLAALHTWTAQATNRTGLVAFVCDAAEDLSGGSFEATEYTGMTGCTLALLACAIDALFLPIMTSLPAFFLCLLACAQFHFMPVFFGDGTESDMLRVLGKGGIVFQIYYATGPGQLHDICGFPMRHYSFVLSTMFVFFDAAAMQVLSLTVKKLLGKSTSDSSNFAEIVVTEVNTPYTKRLKKGVGETRVYFKFQTVKAYDDSDDEDEEDEMEDEGEDNNVEVRGEIMEAIPGIDKLERINLYVEWKRYSDSAKQEIHMGWPVTVKLDAQRENGKWTTSRTTGKGYFTNTYHNGDMSFKDLVAQLAVGDILIFYRDKEDCPFKNEYMCVPKKFRRCTLYFFVQGGLIAYFVFFLNDDTETRSVENVSILKWLIGLVITAIAGDDQAGATYDWLFWRRMFVNIRDRHTLPCENAARKIFWCVPVSLGFEWRVRQAMDFTVNVLFRAILIGLAPILLCVEGPMDFIKDVLAIFFIVQLDDFDEPRSWTSPDVVEDAVDSKFLGPDITDVDAMAKFKKDRELPKHLLEKRARNLMREIGICFMYQSPDEGVWMDAMVDWVSWPFDIVTGGMEERPWKKSLRKALHLRSDPNDGPPAADATGKVAQLRQPLQPHRHRWGGRDSGGDAPRSRSQSEDDGGGSRGSGKDDWRRGSRRPSDGENDGRRASRGRNWKGWE